MSYWSIITLEIYIWSYYYLNPLSFNISIIIESNDDLIMYILFHYVDNITWCEFMKAKIREKQFKIIKKLVQNVRIVKIGAALLEYDLGLEEVSRARRWSGLIKQGHQFIGCC